MVVEKFSASLSCAEKFKGIATLKVDFDYVFRLFNINQRDKEWIGVKGKEEEVWDIFNL